MIKNSHDFVPTSDPRRIRIPGTDRVYDRNKILVVLLVTLMMSLLQVSSVNTALSVMQTSLHASDTALQWVLSGYTLAIGITLVPAGRLGDIFGRSLIFTIGLIVFTLSSFALGFANSTTTLNVLRLIQGFGSGVFSPQITGLIMQYFNGRARAKAFAYFGLVVSMSVAAGPVLSGLFISVLGDNLGWRLAFAVNAPIGLIGVLLAIFWLPFGKERRHFANQNKAIEGMVEPRVRKESSEKIDLDPFGMLLLGSAVVAIMLPFMLHVTAWKWFIMLAGFILLALWILWEHSYQKHGHFPMVDLSLFKIKTFSYSMGIASLQFLGGPSMFVILAIFLQEGLGVSALESGLVTLPNALVSAYAAMWAGKRAYDHGRGIQAIALSLTLLGALSMIIVSIAVHAGFSYWLFSLPLILSGFGGGAMGSANQTQAMLDVPTEHGGTAGGVIQTGQRMATAIGTALVTAVFFATRGTPTDATWYLGIATAYSVIAIIFVIGLIVALVFWRDGYHSRHRNTRTARVNYLKDRKSTRRRKN
ncbi:MFS transporter [Arcanobacterium ihumii]|uniref:MFS transporter n=1 Tax=Arcanobacterium ihumii TaxID=2138162 RepID=UPI000F544FEE|nr:MFS transporter [Arcanobacterium ihumii]